MDFGYWNWSCSKHAFLQQGMFWGANVIPPFGTATEQRNQQTRLLVRRDGERCTSRFWIIRYYSQDLAYSVNGLWNHLRQALGDQLARTKNRTFGRIHLVWLVWPKMPRPALPIDDGRPAWCNVTRPLEDSARHTFPRHARHHQPRRLPASLTSGWRSA